jgi:SAM-dependent methyltransferase
MNFIYDSNKNNYKLLNTIKYGGKKKQNNNIRISKKKYYNKLVKLVQKILYDKPKKALEIINNNKTDIDIYEKLYKLNFHKLSDEQYIIWRKKSAKRKVNYIRDELEKYKNNNYKFIIDIGCEDCFQVKYISKILNIPKYECVNIKDWQGTSYASTREDCNFRYYDGKKLPYKDKTVDVIMAFQTLHHIPNIREYVKEIRRILKNNGLLILREHNNIGNIKPLIDIEHMLYEYVIDGNKEYINTYYGDYYSIDEWKDIIKMKLIYKQKVKSPTNYCYMIFQK